MALIKRLSGALSLACIALAVGGCGVIKDRSNEYLAIESGNELIIPPWYREDKVVAQYPVPELSQQRALPEKFVVPEPPDGTAALGNDPYVIESVEAQTWLHLYTAPGKVWPLLDFFWREYNVQVARENVADGFMVTEPVAKQSNLFEGVAASELTPAAAYQLQAKLSQGVRRNTAELQLRLVPDGNGDDSWATDSKFAKIEALLLEKIGRFVTSEAIENRYSLLANDIGGESRVRILQDEAGFGYLEMQLSFQRAWSEVEQAIDAAAIVVADKDRSEKVFYISRLSEEDVTSWLPFYDESAKRREQNLALEFSVDEDGTIIVRARILNAEWTRDEAETLLNLVFEHVS